LTPAEIVTPDAIIQTALGFMMAKHLFVANEIRLFALLEERACPLDELANRAGIPRHTMRITADAMVALGFVERENGNYSNSAVASAFLSGKGPADLRPLLHFYDQISYLKWAHLGPSIRAGHGTAGRFEFAGQREEEIFSRGVAAFTVGQAQALPDAHDFSRYKGVLDLGGGTGSFLLPLLARYPSLNGTVFELPAAAEVARRFLGSTPFASRIHVVDGDFFHSPIPPGSDAIIVANVIHTLSADHVGELFANLRRSAAAGTRLLLIDVLTNPGHTEPTVAALMAGEFLLLAGEGDVYSAEETQAWLQAAGWRVLECKLLNGPASLMVAEAV
jgi:hypothetical protein